MKRTAYRAFSGGANASLPRYGSFIHGREVFGSKIIESVNPATSQVWAEIASASETELDDAVKSARAGADEWGSMTGMERSRILHKAVALLRERSEYLSQLEVSDTGHCIAEVRDAHTGVGIDTLEYYANLAPEALTGDYLPLANGNWSIVRKEPFGVVGSIVAWNYPIQMALYKLAIALAGGNSVVMKPSSKTPVSTVEMAKIFYEAGLPAGALNIVQGPGSLGGKLAAHSGVNKVTFTGSSPVGVKVLQACAPGIRPATLELGGKSPLIVFEDAHIENAVNATLIANFYTQGEICTNGTRVFVHEKIHDEFVSLLIEKTSKLRIGDPKDENSQIGALIDLGHRDSVMDYVKLGVKEGATLAYGGTIPDMPGDLAKGAFMTPAVFTEVTDDMTIAKDEIFGPVCSVLRFSSDEEAIRRANDSPLGLAGGLFTRDIPRATHVSNKLQCGIVWVNNYNIYDVSMPVGGYKESGFGREFGKVALEGVTQTKSVYFEVNDVPNWD